MGRRETDEVIEVGGPESELMSEYKLGDDSELR
jgi:hypothetical protein